MIKILQSRTGWFKNLIKKNTETLVQQLVQLAVDSVCKTSQPSGQLADQFRSFDDLYD